MNIKVLKENGVEIASVSSDEVLITDVQSALDLMASVRYEVGNNRLILNKTAICEDFFDLKTRLAGDILLEIV